MCMENYFLVKKMFKKWVCTYKLDLKRHSIEWKHTGFLVKKKYQGQKSVKKVMLPVFMNMKAPSTIDIL